MSIAISNSVPNLRVLQKESEQSNPVKDREKAEGVHEKDSESTEGPRDTVEIRNAARFSTDVNPVGREIQDSDDARRSVTEIAQLMNSENGRSSAEQAHEINPGSLINLLV